VSLAVRCRVESNMTCPLSADNAGVRRRPVRRRQHRTDVAHRQPSTRRSEQRGQRSRVQRHQQTAATRRRGQIHSHRRAVQ